VVNYWVSKRDRDYGFKMREVMQSNNISTFLNNENH